MAIKRRVAPAHLNAWLKKVRNNILDYDTNTQGMTKEEKIKFIQRQYYLLNIILRAIDGKVVFTGAYHSKVNDRTT